MNNNVDALKSELYYQQSIQNPYPGDSQSEAAYKKGFYECYEHFFKSQPVDALLKAISYCDEKIDAYKKDLRKGWRDNTTKNSLLIAQLSFEEMKNKFLSLQSEQPVKEDSIFNKSLQSAIDAHNEFYNSGQSVEPLYNVVDTDDNWERCTKARESFFTYEINKNKLFILENPALVRAFDNGFFANSLNLSSPKVNVEEATEAEKTFDKMFIQLEDELYRLYALEGLANGASKSHSTIFLLKRNIKEWQSLQQSSK